MTGVGALRPPFLRFALAVVVALDLVSFYFFLADARAIAVDQGHVLAPFYDFFSRTTVRGGVAFVGILGALGFARKPGRMWEGLLALGALALLSTVHAQLFGSPWRHLYYSGLCLLGWLLGLAVSRRRGAPADESFARIGSLALLGTAYFNAGISKMVYGGISWLSGAPIQAIVVAQDGLVQDSLLSVYRSWVVMTPGVAGLLSLTTLVLELAGPLMIVGSWTRCIVALGLFGMHMNILVMTHILYWESTLLLVLFGLSADEPSTEIVPASVIASRSVDNRFARGAVLLALCALLAITHQSRRFAHSQALKAAADAASQIVPVPEPTAAPLRQVGPFSVGQTIATGWSVEALEITDDGLIAALSGKPGPAKFKISCSPSKSRSPFDLGAAHIFFPNNLQFSELEAVGRAVQELIRIAAQGRDVCEKLASWQTAAQAGRPR